MVVGPEGGAYVKSVEIGVWVDGGEGGEVG